MTESDPWQLVVHPAAASELVDLPEKDFARFQRALTRLQDDPFHPAAGRDVTKLKEMGLGGALYRLRVGKRRAIYAVIRGDRVIYVLVIEDRELGYGRLIELAKRRLAR